jgi:hypothetical protein
MLRILDVYPGSRVLIFINPGTRIPQQQKRSEKNFVVLPLFEATNFTKLITILFLNRYRKKCEPLNKKLTYFSPPKLSLSLKNSKLWVGDPGLAKACPGSQIHGQKRTGSRIQIRNTAQWDPV